MFVCVCVCVDVCVCVEIKMADMNNMCEEGESKRLPLRSKENNSATCKLGTTLVNVRILSRKIHEGADKK